MVKIQTLHNEDWHLAARQHVIHATHASAKHVVLFSPHSKVPTELLGVSIYAPNE